MFLVAFALLLPFPGNHPPMITSDLNFLDSSPPIRYDLPSYVNIIEYELERSSGSLLLLCFPVSRGFSSSFFLCRGWHVEWMNKLYFIILLVVVFFIPYENSVFFLCLLPGLSVNRAFQYWVHLANCVHKVA